MIANTIIHAALKKLLVVQGGQTPTATQYADGLLVLNDMVNSWSAEHSLVYEDTFESLTIPAGTQSITIGATGSLATARPLKIRYANIKEDDTEYELRLMDTADFSTLWDKTITGRPERLYYRETWPNGTIYFDVTTDEEYTLVLTSLKALSTFPDGTTDVSLPAYYERALKANLTIDLADEFGAGNRITQSMIATAMESKMAIIGQGLDIAESRIEFAQVTTQYNSDANQ